MMYRLYTKMSDGNWSLHGSYDKKYEETAVSDLIHFVSLGYEAKLVYGIT